MGRAGKYQFNSVTLTNLGYLQAGIVDTAPSKPGINLQIVKNDANWAGLHDCKTLPAFLANVGEQELAIQNLYQLNANILTKTTSFFGAADTAMQAGFLLVAHVSSVTLEPITIERIGENYIQI